MDIILECINEVTIKSSDFIIFNKIEQHYYVGHLVLANQVSSGYRFLINGKWTNPHHVSYVDMYFKIWNQSPEDLERYVESVTGIKKKESVEHG